MITTKRKKCILVLGMHRSGTSCLTGILQKSGMGLGEVFTQNPYNLKGNRENSRVMALNEAVLKENYCSWDEPRHVSKWTESQQQQRELIIDDIKQSSDCFFGFKDPRVVLTLPFWIETLTPLYIATFRHPHRVAHSLFERSGMPLSQGVELWYQYNSRIYQLLLENNSQLVNFDLPDSEYLIDVSEKIKTLGLNPEKVEKAIEFFSSDLRNQIRIKTEGYKLPKKVTKLYSKLQDYHEEK